MHHKISKYLYSYINTWKIYFVYIYIYIYIYVCILYNWKRFLTEEKNHSIYYKILCMCILHWSNGKERDSATRLQIQDEVVGVLLRDNSPGQDTISSVLPSSYVDFDENSFQNSCQIISALATNKQFDKTTNHYISQMLLFDWYTIRYIMRFGRLLVQFVILLRNGVGLNKNREKICTFIICWLLSLQIISKSLNNTQEPYQVKWLEIKFIHNHPTVK